MLSPGLNLRDEKGSVSDDVMPRSSLRKDSLNRLVQLLLYIYSYSFAVLLDCSKT